MKTLSILGSTGSIGRQTLDVVKNLPEKLKVHALVAGSSVDMIEAQAREFRPQIVAMMQEDAARELRLRLRDLPIVVEQGMPGIIAAVTATEVDTVVTAISGRIGLEPTLAALEVGKNIALANKETLVAAGDLVMATARRVNRSILPVDSEHSAVFQCFGADERIVEKIILTASGGPFRGLTRAQKENITPAMALKHPNWNMGAKITIDSATMMNKGLEVIEAHHLFGLSYEEIEVLIHPQSVVHSMVQYIDGSILAQLGRPDMRLPIQYALSYPTRWPNPFTRLDLKGQSLTFIEPDFGEFPALRLAYEAGKCGGSLPAVMNAANEIAVLAFLQEQISYLRIVEIVEAVCNEHKVLQKPDLASILDADAWARRRAQEIIERKTS